MSENLRVAVHSVGAIIRVGAERFLFQLRDNDPQVVFPAHWGFFGGHVEGMEDFHGAIIRELDEELGLRGKDVRFATEFAVPRYGGWMRRQLFEVRLNEAEAGALTLREGAAMKAMTAAEFLAHDRIVYWDALGLAYALQEDRP